MAFEVQALSVNLMNDTAAVTLTDKEAGRRHINLQVPIESPGNQPENRLKEIAKDAAKRALQDAIGAL